MMNILFLQTIVPEELRLGLGIYFYNLKVVDNALWLQNFYSSFDDET